MNRTHTDSITTPFRGATAGGLALALVLAAGTARAADCDGDGVDDSLQTYFWQATAPSPWNAQFSWFSADGGVPGSTSLAVFDGSSGLGFPPYTVFLTSFRGVRGLNALNAQTTIDLAGQTLDVTGNLTECRELLVGGPNGATLIVTGAGEFRSAAARIADAGGTTATLRIDGLGGPVSYQHLSPTPLVVGERGSGKIELLSSQFLHDGRLVLGEQNGSLGALNTFGSSQVVLASEAFSEVIVGSAGRGEIRLENGAQISTLGGVSLILGEQPSGDGEFDLFQSTAAQTLPVADINIGLMGSGLLRVRQGSSLSTPASLRATIGAFAGSDGEARITTGGFWQISGQPLEVGPGGDGALNIGETGEVESLGGIVAYVDGIIGGSGSVSGLVELAGGEIAPNGQFATSGNRQQLLFTDDVQFAAINPITGLVETGRMTFSMSSLDPNNTMSAVVSGSAALDGTLRVLAVPGFVPAAGVLYPALEATTLSGTFDSVQGPLLDGLVAEPVYPGDGTVYVEFTDRAVGESDLAAPVGFVVPGNFTDGKVVDVTGDGFPDLVALNDKGPGVPGEVVVAANLGTDVGGAWLGFSPAAVAYSTVGDQPRSLDIGDMNGDDEPDLVLLNAGPTSDQIRIRLNNPGQLGDFSNLDGRAISVVGTPIDLVLGDINDDERLDVISIFERAFLRGAGNGGVQTSEDDGGGGFDDTDGDTGDDPGSVDTMGGLSPSGVVVSSKSENSGYVYEPTGVTTSSVRGGPQLPIFLTQIVPTGRNPANVYTDDVDGDGLDDVITSDRISGTISVMRAIDGGPGELFYDDAVSLKATNLGDNSHPGSVVVVDVNGDGLRDLVFTATDIQGATGVRTILNLGADDQNEMLFSHSRRLPGDDTVGATPVGLAVADLDQDGREDVVVLRTQGSGPSVTAHLATAAPPCSAADLAPPFGVLDLVDVNTFIAGFVSQDPIADLTGEGIFDLSDLNLFVSAFLAGCP